MLEEIQLLARSAQLPIDPAKPTENVGSQQPGSTDREAEVLRLVATGRSNRQIAEALFIGSDCSTPTRRQAG